MSTATTHAFAKLKPIDTTRFHEEAVLTPAQAATWDQTRAALLYQQPFFSNILYSMLNKRGSSHIAYFTHELPAPTATDGRSVMLHPVEFLRFSLQEQVFVLAHEVMHCVWAHPEMMQHLRVRGYVSYTDGARLDWSPELFNIAADLVINDLLVQSGVGAMPKCGWHDPKLGRGDESVLDVYRRLYEQAGGGKKGQKGGKGGSGAPSAGSLPGADGKGFDEHLAPGEGPSGEEGGVGQGASPRDEQEWRAAIASAVSSAKLQGKLPVGLQRLIGEMLDPVVDWREHIRGVFARRVGASSYSWRRLDRRLIVRGIGAPGRMGDGAGTVAVAIDTSGSIGETELRRFFTELASILEDVRPQQVIVLWCDAKVHRVDRLDDVSGLADLRRAGAPGGGGTDFRPVFRELDALDEPIDALVYLTDGLGDFPNSSPEYTMIWGNIHKGMQGKYPFGEEVWIDLAE